MLAPVKIHANTPDTLTVSERPYLLAIALGAFLVILLGALAVEISVLDFFSRLAIIFLVAAIVLIINLCLKFVRVEFSKATGRIEFSSRGLFLATRETFALSEFQEAREDIIKDSDSETSRVVLVFSESMIASMDPLLRQKLERRRAQGLRRAKLNEIPLTVYYVSGDSAARAVAAINAFAKSR
jgi:uncharacterized membrane protein